MDLPDHVRVRRRGGLVMAFNCGEVPWTFESSGTALLGDKTIAPCSVYIGRNA
jgi:beta-galactosidase